MFINLLTVWTPGACYRRHFNHRRRRSVEYTLLKSSHLLPSSPSRLKGHLYHYHIRASAWIIRLKHGCFNSRAGQAHEPGESVVVNYIVMQHRLVVIWGIWPRNSGERCKSDPGRIQYRRGNCRRHLAW